MKNSYAQGIVRRNLEKSGINIGGPNPWDPIVHDDAFYSRVMWGGMLGLGDSYVDGQWDCRDLAEFFNKAIQGGLLKTTDVSLPAFGKHVREFFLNKQAPRAAVENVTAHYVERDELVLSMTGNRKAYSCAFFQDLTNPKEGLDAAQDFKLDLICRKLGLNKNHRFLDIGCGWGSLLGFAKDRYGVMGTGITPAPNQAKYIGERYGNKVIVDDYRSLTGTYDRIASVGMFEHVGVKNYRTYMETVARTLENDGLFLLHTFGIPSSDVPLLDPWTDRHIFPGIDTPTVAQILAAAEGLLEVEHVDEWGQHYDPTLMLWSKNFDEYAERVGLKEKNEKLYRLWDYYLKSCAGAFRAGEVSLWQFVFRKRGSRKMYSFTK